MLPQQVQRGLQSIVVHVGNLVFETKTSVATGARFGLSCSDTIVKCGARESRNKVGIIFHALLYQLADLTVGSEAIHIRCGGVVEQEGGQKERRSKHSGTHDGCRVVSSLTIEQMLGEETVDRLALSTFVERQRFPSHRGPDAARGLPTGRRNLASIWYAFIESKVAIMKWTKVKKKADQQKGYTPVSTCLNNWWDVLGKLTARLWAARCVRYRFISSKSKQFVLTLHMTCEFVLQVDRIPP